jgi:hypothetical protein
MMLHQLSIPSWGVVLVVCLGGWRASLQAATLATPAEPNAAEVTKRAMDATLSPAERESAYNDIDRLPPDEQRKALFEILTSAHLAMAERAAMRVVLDNIGSPAEVANLIGKRIDGWSSAGQAGVLSLIAKKVRPPAAFVDLARAFLRRYLATDRVITVGDRASAAELGALILALDGTPDDAAMIAATVQRQSRSPMLWWATAGSGGAAGAVLTLARSMYREGAGSEALRLAAATAAAAGDPDAQAFVIGRLEGAFNELADKDEQALHATARSPEELATLEQRIASVLQPIPALRFLNGPAAEQHTRRGIDVANDFIRAAAGVTAAVRWPAQLLEGRPTRMPALEYERLLAVLVVRHPDSALRAEQALGRPLSDEAKQRALVAGLGGFGRAGTFVNGL